MRSTPGSPADSPPGAGSARPPRRPATTGTPLVGGSRGAAPRIRRRVKQRSTESLAPDPLLVVELGRELPTVRFEGDRARVAADQPCHEKYEPPDGDVARVGPPQPPSSGRVSASQLHAGRLTGAARKRAHGVGWPRSLPRESGREVSIGADDCLLVLCASGRRVRGGARIRRGAVVSTSSPARRLFLASQAHARKRALPDESEIQRRDDARPAARLLLAVLLLELSDPRLSSLGARRHLGL